MANKKWCPLIPSKLYTDLPNRHRKEAFVSLYPLWNDLSDFLGVKKARFWISRLGPESNKERVGFGPLLITVLFLALKKTGFSKKKILPKKKYIFFLPFFYATFQCRLYVFKGKKFFFCPWKHKKTSSKAAHNQPKTFFSCTGWLPKPAQIWFFIL